MDARAIKDRPGSLGRLISLFTVSFSQLFPKSGEVGHPATYGHHLSICYNACRDKTNIVWNRFPLFHFFQQHSWRPRDVLMLSNRQTPSMSCASITQRPENWENCWRDSATTPPNF